MPGVTGKLYQANFIL